jgi:hypothetical protein
VPWEKVQAPRSGYTHWLGIVPWDRGFAAVSLGKRWRVRLWVSEDGRGWAERPLPVLYAKAPGLQPFGQELLFTTDIGVRPVRMDLDVWASSNAHTWTYRGNLVIDGAPDGNQIDISIAVLHDRLIAYGQIGPMLCCGVAPGVARTREGAHRRSPATAPPATWTWLSRDGSAWSRHRTRGPTAYLSHVQRVGRRYSGVSSDRGRLWFVESHDAITWRKRFALPQDLDETSGFELLAVAGGLVLIGDTSEPRGTTDGARTTAWRISHDGRATEVFDQVGLYAGTAAVSANRSDLVVAGWGNAFASKPERPAALVSRDAGQTYQLSEGWPTMGTTGFFSVAIAGNVVLAQGQGPRVGKPALFRAELP